MSEYEPIPVPGKLLWREFKVRFLPLIVFSVVLLSALIVWMTRLGPTSILGEAENVQTDVVSAQTGVITELKVRSFQEVKKGDVLGKVVGADPKNPATLVAPLDGAVTYLHHLDGEKVTAGQTVLVVSSSKPDRIVAYLRQPINFEPTPGMRATIRTRARNQREGESQILKVSPQLSTIPGTLLPIRDPQSEKGLPVILSVPSNLSIFPGELVEVKIFPGTSGNAPAPAAN